MIPIVFGAQVCALISYRPFQIKKCEFECVMGVLGLLYWQLTSVNNSVCSAIRIAMPTPCADGTTSFSKLKHYPIAPYSYIANCCHVSVCVLYIYGKSVLKS